MWAGSIFSKKYENNLKINPDFKDTGHKVKVHKTSRSRN